MNTQSRPGIARLVLVLGALSAFAPISVDLYLPGLPTIAREFGTDTAAAQRTLSLFFVGLAGGQILYGPISDRVGRRGPLLFGLTLYTLASIGCALAPSLDMLVLARLGQALGGCAGMVIARSVVRDYFAPQDSARIFSFLMLVMGVAPITAPLIGGQLIAWLGWRPVFWVLTGFGLLCLAMVLLSLPESLPAERRARSGLGEALRIYGRLLIDRHFLAYALAGGLISAAMFAYIAGSPFVIIELYGVPTEQFGWIFGTNALGLIAASQLNRRLLARYSSDAILRVTLVASVVAAMILLAAVASGVGGLAGLLPPLFVCVSSLGLVSPNASAAALAPHGRAAGSASALLGALQFGIGTLSSGAVELLHNGTAMPMALTIAVCCGAALLCMWALADRPASQPVPGGP